MFDVYIDAVTSKCSDIKSEIDNDNKGMHALAPRVTDAFNAVTWRDTGDDRDPPSPVTPPTRSRQTTTKDHARGRYHKK